MKRIVYVVTIVTCLLSCQKKPVSTSSDAAVSLDISTLYAVGEVRYEAPTRSVVVRKEGDGYAEYTVSNDEDWLVCIGPTGTIDDVSGIIKLEFQTVFMPVGVYHDTLIITSNTNRVELPVILYIVEVFKSGDSIIDVRDGQKYGTVQIGSQTWMSENLNIGTFIPFESEMSDNGITEKWTSPGFVDS